MNVLIAFDGTQSFWYFMAGQGKVDTKSTSQRQGQREMRDVFVFSIREDKVVWKAFFLEEMAEKCAKYEKPYKVIVQGSRVFVSL